MNRDLVWAAVFAGLGGALIMLAPPVAPASFIVLGATSCTVAAVLFARVIVPPARRPIRLVARRTVAATTRHRPAPFDWDRSSCPTCDGDRALRLSSVACRTCRLDQMRGAA